MSKDASNKRTDSTHFDGQGSSPPEFTPPDSLPVFSPIERLELLEQAKRLATEQVENTSVPPATFHQLSDLEPEQAIKGLAEYILRNAGKKSIHVPEPNTTGVGKPSAAARQKDNSPRGD